MLDADRMSNPYPQEVAVRMLVVSLSAVFMLAAVTAVAQDKTKDLSMAGHAGMAGGAKSDAAVIAKAISAAPPDIAKNAAVMGMSADGKMKELRAGTNGWMCMLDLAGDSMCLDKEWQAWGDAWMNKKDPPKPKTVGVAYMLKGDKGASNTDPYATKATADNQWVVSGPHIMLLPTDASQLDAYPTDWTKGGPWVMWKGTPYAHIMVPTTSMAKSARKAPAQTQSADMAVHKGSALRRLPGSRAPRRVLELPRSRTMAFQSLTDLNRLHEIIRVFTIAGF